jgi:glycosyltransferase involved in cell wall biosynthesis
LQGEDAYRGIGHYVRGLTEGLLRLARDRERGEEAGPRLDIVLFWDARRSPPQLEYEGAEAQVEVWPEEEGRFRSRLREWGIGSAPDARALVRAAHRARVEVLHIGSPLHGPFEWCVAKGLPLVATVFDLIPWQRRAQYLDVWPAVARRRYLARLRRLEALSGILAISESVKRDLQTELPRGRADIQVVYPGLRGCFLEESNLESPRDSRSESLVGAKPYVLAFGSENPSKNTDGLLEAWKTLPDSLRAGFTLCLLGSETGREWRREEEGIVCLRRPDDADLARLYRQARVFVMPSFAEGFGLPVLEAMGLERRFASERRYSQIAETSALFQSGLPEQRCQLTRVLEIASVASVSRSGALRARDLL